MNKKIFLFILIAINVICKSDGLEDKLKNFYKEKRVLVTGGAGFIGSHLADKLVEYGASVKILDNLSTGKIENIQNILDKITLIKKDIIGFNYCLETTKNIDIIFHLAAFISVPESLNDPKICHDTNIKGLFNILEAARLNKVSTLIFSSSSAVYGEQERLCSEDLACNPQSPYGFSKLIGELYCKQFSLNFGLKTLCLRYFNVYGNRQNPNGSYAAVVAKFMDLMSQNKPLIIYGDGKQTRDFIPVEKVVEANLVLAMLPSEYLNGEVVNVATGKSINIFELIELLKQNYPKYSAEIKFTSQRPGDLKYSSADCAKLNYFYSKI